MTRTRRLAALGLALAAVLFAGRFEREAAERRGPTPLRALARDLEWVRFQRARLAGDAARAIEHAERAVRFDPGATDGWELLATHLAVFHGSPVREPDPARRRRWFEAGLATAERGEGVAREPARLLRWRALAVLDRLRLDPELYPGGPAVLVERARGVLAEARAKQLPEAELFTRYLEESQGARASTDG